jgi:excinuclease ABC subunit A
LFVYAPVVRDRRGEHRAELDALQRGGFVRVRIDGELLELAERPALEKTKRHTIEVLVDRLKVGDGIERRLADSLEVAFTHAGGTALVEVTEPRGEPRGVFFSQRHACPTCGVSYPELTPRLFSFNGPYGACEGCGGLGVRRNLDPARIVSHPARPLPEALTHAVRRALPALDVVLPALAAHYGVSPDAAYDALPAAFQEALLHGTGETEVAFPPPAREPLELAARRDREPDGGGALRRLRRHPAPARGALRQDRRPEHRRRERARGARARRPSARSHGRSCASSPHASASWSTSGSTT